MSLVVKAKNYLQANLPAIFTSLVIGLFLLPSIFRFQSLYWGTPALQFIPWRIFAFEEISQGRIPFFNPYNGMNAPFLANYQSAFFYPPGWLLFVFGIFGGNSMIAWGFGVLNYLHMVWAAFGMMLLARELGISKFGQTVSAVAFACSQLFLSRQGFISMIWTAAWFPWLILLIEKQRLPYSSKNSRGLVLCVGFMLLAGHAQWSAYQLLFGAIWWVWRCFTDQARRTVIINQSLNLVRDIALGIGLASIQLIPTAELLINSQRASSVDYELAMTYSFWPWRLLTLFLPNLFGNPGTGNYWGYGAYWEDAYYFGVLPAILLFLSLRAFFRRWENDGETKQLALFLWGSAVVSTILAMGKNTPIFPFLYRHIPGFDMFQAPARLMLLAVFSFSLLAGLGWRYWNKPEGGHLYWTRLGTAGSAAIAVTSLVIHRMGIIERESISLAFFVLGIFLFLYGVLSLTIGMEGVKKKIWILIVFLFVPVDLYVANIGIIPWIDAHFFRIDQSKPMTAEKNSDPFVYFPEQDLYNIKFNKFLKFADFGNKATHYDLRKNIIPDINIIDHIPVLNNFDPLLPSQYVTFMNYLDKLPVEAQEAWLHDLGISVRMSANKQNEAVFEYLQSDFKPVVWTNCAIYSSGGNKSLEKVNEQILAQGTDYSHQNRCAIVLEKTDLTGSIDLNTNANIAIISTSPQKIVVDITADVDGWVTFRRSWYPGWKTRIDGEDAKDPVITDVNFMGMAVPAGKHRLELFYYPAVFYIGLMISAVSLGFWGYLTVKN